ncbi:tetratricopeptide repeat protein [Bradyrhizobium sp. CSA112]|uniref:CHAT domain-containing protein n=1 Tax=Bradyrhizobium sp. CSA112 TaxID=2699170 RepID=UPI0023B053E0|nr:CHAT domain-containing protein [Bradyrhizobium sp. CSA112]MDE5454134.1 tetratricopeptide repeat protein [Bradyrhizobium sp. CSA112]
MARQMRRVAVSRLAIAVVAFAIFVASFASARSPKDNPSQQLQLLVTEVGEAVKAGDSGRGLLPAQQALRLARKVFGNRDPRTLAILVSLAQLYQLGGRSDEAEPLFREAASHFQEAMQARRKKLGPRHPQTLISIVGLAQVYQAWSHYSEAEPLFKEALQTGRETLGQRHPQTLISIDGLAQVYRSLSRYDEAEPLYREALKTRREMLGARHQDTLGSLNALASFYRDHGRYEQAEPFYLEALQASRETLGPRHPQTLNYIDALAHVYQYWGHWEQAESLYQEVLQANRETLGPHNANTLSALDHMADFYVYASRIKEAEPLYQAVLQERRNVLGARHPDTLSSLGRLAMLYQTLGRTPEAAPLFREALQVSSETLGPRHQQTVTARIGLGFVLQSEGRYGEAEPHYREALQASRDAFGPRHLNTLLSLNRLAELHIDQGRYSEAEQLYGKALQASREAFGPRHLSTVLSLRTLASLYQDQHRYGEAEPLFLEALQASRETLGRRHVATLVDLHNLALLYKDQRRYSEAEPLFLETLQVSREVQGPRHPNTLNNLKALADLYQAEARYAEADELFLEALQTSLEVLGPRHPGTLRIQLSSAFLLVNQGRREEAVKKLQQMEPHLLGWIGQELYSTETDAVRRRLVSSQAPFQDAVLNLAIAENSSEARRVAGNVILRFKLLQSEEESYLARITRGSQDPRVRTLAGEVGKLRAALVTAAQAEPGVFDKALQALDAKQRELGEFSRLYKDHLRVLTANLEDVRAAVPPRAVLIEFRQFRPVDFRTGKPDAPRFAAMLLAGSDDPVLADLGPISDMPHPTTALTDEAAATLYRQLFAPFEQQLASASTVYVAPDGILNLVPFAQLRLADGRYWGERQELRLLQSGRDLLRADPDKQARGLVALGGIDFGAAPAEAKNPSSVVYTAVNSDAVTRAAGSFRDGFAQLAASSEEAMGVKEWYQRLRKDEPAELWSGMGASKLRLMAMTPPPRVLHLATHGFYLANETRDPMLQSGIALADANRGLAAKSADGILFALEAQGLNLEGSELVVLSACGTAQGSLDYSEGVYGLVRALRTAGARKVLVTLWPLNDGEARDFMIKFYKTWLTQERSDPAKALRDVQLSYLKDDKLYDPRIWAPYILIE